MPIWRVWPPAARDSAGDTPLWLSGANFVNVSGAVCRVGPHTTRAVVLSCITVLAADYVITSYLL